jgi:hypothetical protein
MRTVGLINALLYAKRDKNMDVDLSTILLVIATIIAPVFALLINYYLQQQKYPFISKNRKDAISKKWVGEYQVTCDRDSSSTNTIAVKIEVSFSSKGRKLIGKGCYLFKNNTTEILLEGHLKDNHVLIFEYKNPDQSKFHFGNIILYLNSNADMLTGCFIGNGRLSDGPIAGHIELKCI